MPKLGSHHHWRARGSKGPVQVPRDLALEAIEALARYKLIALPGESLHKEVSARLARVVKENSW